ncbi:unnamed protein product [Rotaria magnacalcarata]
MPPSVKSKRRKKPNMNDDDNRKPYRLGCRPGEQGPRPLSSNRDRIEKLATGKTGTTTGQIITYKTTGVKTSNVKIGRQHWKITFDAIGISEVRWTGKGEAPSGDFIWSGEDTTHTRGVGVLLSAKTKKTLIGYNPISSRVITARFSATPFKLTVIHVYAPKSASSDDEIEIFYDSIEHALTQTAKMDIIIVTGDWDAKIGSDNIHWKSVMARYEYGDINERERPTSRVHSTTQSIHLQYTILTKSK